MFTGPQLHTENAQVSEGATRRTLATSRSGLFLGVTKVKLVWCGACMLKGRGWNRGSCPETSLEISVHEKTVEKEEEHRSRPKLGKNPKPEKSEPW